MTAAAQHFPRQFIPLLVALTTFWGFNWPMMKLALAEMGPTHFRSLCLVSGAIGVFAMVVDDQKPPTDRCVCRAGSGGASS